MTIPEVRASWLTETREPLIPAGAISDMYMGDTNEAMPIATPTTILPAIRSLTLGAKEVPRAPRVNMTALMMIILRLP
jgi:hypothetical protein